MSHGPYRLQTWLLRAVKNAGPLTKTTLRGLARHHQQLEQFENTFRGLLLAGSLKKYGRRRDARYGLPGYRKPSPPKRKTHERPHILR